MGLRLRSNEARRPFPRKPSGRRAFWIGASLSRTSQPALGMFRPLRLAPIQNPKSPAAAPLAILRQTLKFLSDVRAVDRNQSLGVATPRTVHDHSRGGGFAHSITQVGLLDHFQHRVRNRLC